MPANFLSAFASPKSIFQQEVKERFNLASTSDRTITEADLEKVPNPVARYLQYCGWVGEEIPRNFYLQFEGDFSLKKGKYMKVKSEQYSWFERPTRLFLIHNWMISGRHRYDERGAFMLIKLLGRFKVVDASGKAMDQSELVTYLNDLFIVAPGALVEVPLAWESIDEYTVKATISQFGYTVSAIVSFNEKGELVNFVSYDRIASNDGINGQQVPWSTPMSQYVQMDGRMVPSYGEAIWHYPDGNLVYAKLKVKTVRWNIREPYKL